MSTLGGHGAALPVPPVLRDSTIQQVHATLLGQLVVGMLYATHAVYTARYYRQFGGRKGDKLTVQVYVGAALLLGSIFLAANLTVPWELLTHVVTFGVTDMSVSDLNVWWTWSLVSFTSTSEAYWVWRACRVSRQPFVRLFAIALMVASSASFIALSSIITCQRFGLAVTTKQLQIPALVGIWLLSVDYLFCAGVLAYELVWKRRAQVVHSPVVSAFTGLALKTSVFICVGTMAGAACITVAYATSDGTAYNAFAFFACTFPFASSTGACVSLLHRNALRAAHESTLGAGPSPPQGATPPSARCACHGGDTRYCKSLSVAHTAAHVAELGPSAAARPPDDEAAPAPHLSSVTGAASRDLAFPVALPLLRCGRGGGTGTRGRVDRASERARRKREVEERASRSSGISVTVEVQVTEEQAEDDFVPTEDGYHLVEEEEEEEGGSPPKARGSQGSSPSVVPQGKPR